ncbi:MAG: hypothetical protein K2W80_18125, partial [Burkholderiales bacterium]|nr:hypothetical protein [Burkholderiales bacterium]
GDEVADVQREAVYRLIGLLRQQDMAALGGFEALSGALRRRMEPAEHHRLSEDIANLEFQRAAQALDDRFRQGAAPPIPAQHEGRPNLV